MSGTTDLQGLEHEVEATRQRFTRSLDKLTSPETSAAAKKEAMDYAQGVKADVMEYVDKTKDQILETARASAQEKARSLTDDLKAKALANPVGVALIGAGIAWRFYKKPPVTTLLVGTGIALLMSGGGSKRGTGHLAYRAPYDRERPSRLRAGRRRRAGLSG
jgi:hypothetical protein